jgi:probable rRNA maturation factor
LKVRLSVTEFGKEVNELLEQAVISVCSKSEVRDGEISVTLLGDHEIQELNLSYLDVDSPTDVIAFSLYVPGEAVVGDIYIGYQQAMIEAVEREIPIEVELVRLVIHGTLHVLGHDHPDTNERYGSDMFLFQENLVKELINKKSD